MKEYTKPKEIVAHNVHPKSSDRKGEKGRKEYLKK